MNYIKQINGFWELEREREDITAHVQSFYFALLYFANKASWEEFSLYREDITHQAKISNNTYYQVRDIAVSAGLITYTEGKNKRSKCTFCVLPLYQNQDTTRTYDDTLPEHEVIHKEDTTETYDDTLPKHEVIHQVDTNYDHTNKPLNNKPINLKGDVDAAASPPGKKGSRSSAKQPKKEKEIPPGSAPPPKEKEDPHHSDYVDAYWKWYEEKVEMPPKLLESDYKALKNIRRYLVDSVHKGDSGKALTSWRYILNNWGRLEDFLQKQMRPAEIDRNMVNILNQLRDTHSKVSKNAGNITNSSRQPSNESLEDIQERYK